MNLTDKVDEKWANDVLTRVENKMKIVSKRSEHKVPYSTKDGIHDDKSNESEIGWWTNGFWGGIMWQMYMLTHDKQYRCIAEELEQKLDSNLMDYYKLDHDNGFKWLPTAVANYKITGNKKSRNRALLAAGNLAGRFNHNGRFIRAWNEWDDKDEKHIGWAIIDCMMNLPLLYWASNETMDPRFAQIATMHADTTMKYFVREDGSVNHIVEIDPNTGNMIQSFGGQGYGVGSSWTRGQGWGLYGFVLSYLYTGKKEYLDTAEKIADYFCNHIPDNGHIPVDFKQPDDITWVDDTAAAIASCGLIELSRIVDEARGNRYLEAAKHMMYSLVENDVNWNNNEDNLLIRCTAAYHDKSHEFSIIYGDYYFIEALLKLTRQEWRQNGISTQNTGL